VSWLTSWVLRKRHQLSDAGSRDISCNCMWRNMNLCSWSWSELWCCQVWATHVWLSYHVACLLHLPREWWPNCLGWVYFSCWVHTGTAYLRADRWLPISLAGCSFHWNQNFASSSKLPIGLCSNMVCSVSWNWLWVGMIGMWSRVIAARAAGRRGRVSQLHSQPSSWRNGGADETPK